MTRFDGRATWKKFLEENVQKVELSLSALEDPTKRVKFTEQLTTQVQVGQSERLVTYLNFIGKCPKYSRRNRILIASLAPEATIVRGYNDWEKDGFQVRYMNKDPSKGKVEHDIGILAPHIIKVPDLEAKKQGEDKTKQVVDYYFPVFVFDVKHLTPESQERITQFLYNCCLRL